MNAWYDDPAVAEQLGADAVDALRDDAERRRVAPAPRSLADLQAVMALRKEHPELSLGEALDLVRERQGKQ